MSICSHCKRPIPDDSSVFCPYCGKKAEATKKCPKCRKELKSSSKYCAYCGNDIDEELTCPKCKTKIASDTIFCPTCGLKHYISEDKVTPSGAVLYEAHHYRSHSGSDGTLCIFDNKIHFESKSGAIDNISMHDVVVVTKTVEALHIRTLAGTVYRYTAPKKEQVFLDYLTAMLRDCIKWDVLTTDVVADLKTTTPPVSSRRDEEKTIKTPKRADTGSTIKSEEPKIKKEEPYTPPKRDASTLKKPEPVPVKKAETPKPERTEFHSVPKAETPKFKKPEFRSIPKTEPPKTEKPEFRSVPKTEMSKLKKSEPSSVVKADAAKPKSSLKTGPKTDSKLKTGLKSGLDSAPDSRLKTGPKKDSILRKVDDSDLM